VEAWDLVGRNVALVSARRRRGRGPPSKSMTPEEARSVMTAGPEPSVAKEESLRLEAEGL